MALQGYTIKNILYMHEQRFLNGQYGIEFEMIKKVHERIGNGKYFTHCGDGSISGCDNGEHGIEYKTKILDSTKWHVVKRFLNRCKTATVNRSTGLHIHYGIHDKPERDERVELMEKLELLAQFIVRHQDIIFSLVPKSRRNNRYAKSMKPLVGDSCTRCDGDGNCECGCEEDCDCDCDCGCTCNESILEKWSSSRYYWINIQNVPMHQNAHIEVRLHSGTLSYIKTKYWHDLMYKFLQFGYYHPFVHFKSLHDMLDGLDIDKVQQLHWFQRRDMFNSGQVVNGSDTEVE